jgi:hypothetical protein
MVGKPCTQKLVVFHYSDFASLAFEDFSWKINSTKLRFRQPFLKSAVFKTSF